MGLDLVDITLSIEDEFGVPFSHEDLDALWHDRDIVVGDLYQRVLEKLHLKDVGRYDIQLNRSLWIEIRGLLHSVTEAPSEEIQLKTHLADLFPHKTRHTLWRVMSEVSPYRIRQLDYPWGARALGLSLAGVMVVAELLQVWQLAPWVLPMLGLLGVWLLVETYAKMLSMFSPFRRRFPARMETVKDLCKSILAANYEEICTASTIPLDERCHEVWERLRQVIVGVLGVPSEEVTFQSRLVADLCME